MGIDQAINFHDDAQLVSGFNGVVAINYSSIWRFDHSLDKVSSLSGILKMMLG